jgi:ubiquitin-conjugating enzyme E2 variant
MPCVAPDGSVDAATFRVLRSWRRSCTLESLLTELRAEMAAPGARRLPQPPEGSTYGG